MSESIEKITTAALSAALQAGATRHALIASNIANGGSEGYVPLRLSFDAHLAGAREALAERGVLDRQAVESLRGEIEPLLDEAGGAGKVQVDQEMADMARNAVHFQALSQALSRHLSVLAMAAADGRR
jgi:flagellar basal-body rod protein FlgB